MTEGMQKRGMARRDQAGWVSKAQRDWGVIGEHTDSNDVGNSAKLAQVKLSSLDLLATSGETDGNGSSVRGSQANDTDTREGVEGSRGTKVDDTEDDLDNHAEHHGVERNVERSVDLGPPLGTGDGTVTSESPCASRSGSCATNTANDGENDEREEESKGTTGAANGGLDDEWHWLGGQNDFLEIGEDEHQRDDEEETGEGVDEDGGDHSLGDLDGGVLDFLAHGDNHASGRSSVGSVEETDTERPALGPSRVGLEMTKDISGITAAFLCDSEDTDDNGDNTSESPEHSSGLCNKLSAYHSITTKDSSHTSIQGRYLFPSAETALHRKVRPRKTRKTW
jgi:hypothetical protein